MFPWARWGMPSTLSLPSPLSPSLSFCMSVCLCLSLSLCRCRCLCLSVGLSVSLAGWGGGGTGLMFLCARWGMPSTLFLSLALTLTHKLTHTLTHTHTHTLSQWKWRGDRVDVALREVGHAQHALPPSLSRYASLSLYYRSLSLYYRRTLSLLSLSLSLLSFDGYRVDAALRELGHAQLLHGLLAARREQLHVPKSV